MVKQLKKSLAISVKRQVLKKARKEKDVVIEQVAKNFNFNKFKKTELQRMQKKLKSR